MHLNPGFLQHIKHHFSRFFEEETSVSDSYKVEGGDICQAYALVTNKGKFFIKLNSALFGLDFFEKEARGLVAMANAGALKVPRPLFDGKFNQQIYLVMEWLENTTASNGFWKNFGYAMAGMHKNSNDQFGLEHDNYIGKLHQLNNRTDLWTEFYSRQRIMPLVSKAYKQSLLQAEDVDMAEQVCRKIDSIIPSEKPALLHGDLWKGNFMAIENNQAAIFDPAVYYGHREMDLAMTMLFGGFDEEFYDAYGEVYPQQPGFSERKEIFQLYPLLVHLLLFGGPYYMPVKKVLEKYS